MKECSIYITNLMYRKLKKLGTHMEILVVDITMLLGNIVSQVTGVGVYRPTLQNILTYYFRFLDLNRFGYGFTDMTHC